MALAGRTRILIVDDSVVMRSLLRTVVATDSALEVVGSAADGASALTSIESSKPDLVLLDVEMPVMDGLATLRELRTRGHNMPVIMCSSLTHSAAPVSPLKRSHPAPQTTWPSPQANPGATRQSIRWRRNFSPRFVRSPEQVRGPVRGSRS